MNIVNLLVFWLAEVFLYIVAFLYFVSNVLFLYSVLLTIVLHEWRRKGTWFVQFILCLEHFVYFPGAKLLAISCRKLNIFQSDAHTMAMLTLRKLSAVNACVDNGEWGFIQANQSIKYLH